MAIALIEIPGLGPKTAEYLSAQGINSAEGLLKAGLECLVRAPGFGDSRARQVMDAAASLVVDAEEAAGDSDKGPAKVETKIKKKSKSDKDKKKSKKGGKKKKAGGKKEKKEKKLKKGQVENKAKGKKSGKKSKGKNKSKK